MVRKTGCGGLCSTALHKYFYVTVAKVTLLKHVIKVTKSLVQKLKAMLENSSLPAQRAVTLHVHKEAHAALILLFPNFWQFGFTAF